MTERRLQELLSYFSDVREAAAKAGRLELHDDYEALQAMGDKARHLIDRELDKAV